MLGLTRHEWAMVGYGAAVGILLVAVVILLLIH
jgi:hypothetical protein